MPCLRQDARNYGNYIRLHNGRLRPARAGRVPETSSGLKVISHRCATLVQPPGSHGIVLDVGLRSNGQATIAV